MVNSLLYCAATNEEHIRLGRLLAGILLMLSLVDLMACRGGWR